MPLDRCVAVSDIFLMCMLEKAGLQIVFLPQVGLRKVACLPAGDTIHRLFSPPAMKLL